MKQFWNTLDNLLTFGYMKKSKEKFTKSSHYKVVTAGDPCVYIRIREYGTKLKGIKSFGQITINTDDFEAMLVLGNSMSPMGIQNGDLLLSKPYAGGKISKGQYLILEVDPDYYRKYKGEESCYDYKLRKSLLSVSVSDTLDQIISNLEDIDHEEIWLPENKQNLTKKYNLAKKAYPSDDLLLSVTFKNGVMKYSFHPVRMIKYIVDYQVKVQHGQTDKLISLKSA